MVATYSYLTQFHFLGYGCLNYSLIYLQYIYIYKIFTCLQSLLGRQEKLWMKVIHQLLDGYLRTGLALGGCFLTEHLTVWHCLLLCGMYRLQVPSCISKYSSIRIFKDSFQDYYLDHQSQSQIAVIIPIVIIAAIILQLEELPSFSENSYLVFVTPSWSFYHLLYL